MCAYCIETKRSSMDRLLVPLEAFILSAGGAIGTARGNLKVEEAVERRI